MSFHLQLSIVQSTRFCPWCCKPIPHGNGNVYEHCAGRAHVKAIADFNVEQAQGVESDEWVCRLCSTNVPRNWSSAVEHVQGSRHFRLACEELQREITRAREPAVDPEVAKIVNNGECSVCRKPVGRHISVATEHIAGAAHKLFQTLASADWKTGLAQLQKSAEGLEMKVGVAGVKPSLTHLITAELGVPLSVQLVLSNTSKRTHMLRRILVIPPAKAETLGLTLRLGSSQLSLAPGYCVPFDNKIILPASELGLLGRHELLFAFSFAKALLLQTITVSVVAKGSASIVAEQARLAANAFVPGPKLNPSDVRRLAQKIDYVPGERLAAEVHAEVLYVRKLPYFDLPKTLPPRAAYLRVLQPRLSIDTYAARFNVLLQLEEIQMNIDILNYDRVSTLSTASKRPGLLRLQVDGLAESRPSVQKGDSILASVGPIELGSRSRVFEGFVHHVEREDVFLKFHGDFHAAHISGRQYHIRFRFNRMPIRRMHMGVQDLVSTGAQARFLLEGASNSTSKPATSSASSSSASSSSSPAGFSGPSLLVTDDPDAADAWVRREVFAKRVNRIGLDTESAMDYRSPNELAIVQMATVTAVLVYRIYATDPELPDAMFSALDDGSITKYSVGRELELMALLELGEAEDFVNLQSKDWGGRLSNRLLKGTQQLADEYAPALKFVKNKALQTSDWGQWPLTPMQQEYAANDAIIALAIGTKIFASKTGQPPQMPSALVKYTPGAISASSSSSSSSSSASLSFTSKNLNSIQREAVVKIMQGDYHPRPFLLFGPPGTGQTQQHQLGCRNIFALVRERSFSLTRVLFCFSSALPLSLGKTTVLVEAIQQLLKQSQSIRILAVAPSNSAADLFIERLSNLGKDEMYRLNAIGRNVGETPEDIKKYSSVTGETFRLISRESLLKFRVVVSTAISAANLTGLGCKPGDFTHIVCDENGHATECESMAAFGGLVDPSNTRVVLGGDPKQLGPVVRSPDADKGGLGVSLLERLMAPYVGGSDDGGEKSSKGDRCMTKLLYNYRSHPAILATPNALFYSNELIPAADELVRRSLCAWPSFPQKDFPLLFHHINGKEQREKCSPSWCNLDEMALILTYVRELLEWKRGAVLPRDIGIISPYHRQVQQIRMALHTMFEQLGRDAEWRDLKVGSCEEFQGQERRVILISTVRSQMLSLESFDVKFQLGFVHQPKRMNVALTRAKQALIIVGNGEVLKTDANWKRVLLHCQANGAVRGDFKIATTAAAGAASSSSSSSAVGDDGDLVSGLEHLISMKQLAERSEAQAADARAAAMEDEEQDGWQLVPSSDKPWKQSD